MTYAHGFLKVCFFTAKAGMIFNFQQPVKPITQFKMVK
jgi:hypothetical protein